MSRASRSTTCEVAVDGSPVMADMTQSGMKPALASRPATDIEAGGNWVGHAWPKWMDGLGQQGTPVPVVRHPEADADAEVGVPVEAVSGHEVPGNASHQRAARVCPIRSGAPLIQVSHDPRGPP